MKKVILFFMFIFLMTGVCGCSMKGQAKIDRMLNYINDKYVDDSFEYISLTGGHLGSNVTNIIVKSKNYPNKEIRVICYEIDDKESFSDTYLNVKFEIQTYDYIKSALSKAYGDNIYLKYIPDDIASMKNGTSDTTFYDYISDPSTYIYFSAAVTGIVDNEEIAFKTIKEIFSNAVVRADIYYINTNEYIVDNGYIYIKNNNYEKNLYFVKETIDKYSKIEWMDRA